MAPVPLGTLGPYELQAQLGEGGMGTVYKAYDPRLGRSVAIKRTKEEFAQRFANEARAIAALNHPNICSVYDVGPDYLVMEFVPGETLGDRIARGALPSDEVLRIARQVADALEAAHAKGIVHRDLKPGNIMLTPNGEVKILDFGLATAANPDLWTTLTADSTTMTLQAPEEGMFVGTPAYMPPEVFRGARPDWRADIWAFGVILYEMLAGKRLFPGPTVSDVAAEVLRGEIDWKAIEDRTSPHFLYVIRLCLTRDRALRLQSIGDFRVLLDQPPPVAPAATAMETAKSRWPMIAGTLLAGAVLAGATAWALRPKMQEAAMRRISIPVSGLSARSAAISPDGQKVAYVAERRLWVRELGQIEAREIDTSEGAMAAFWSPDGAEIGGQFLGKGLWRYPLEGAGGSVKIADSGPSAGSPVWLSDGSVVFSESGPESRRRLLRVSATGGAPQPFADVDGSTELDFHELAALPGAQGVLAVVHTREGPYPLDLIQSGKRQRFYRNESQNVIGAAWSPTSHILVVLADGAVLALPVATGSWKVNGDPFLVATGAQSISISRGGMLALGVAPVSSDFNMIWAGRDGADLRGVRAPPSLAQFSISPDGRRIAGYLTNYARRGLVVWDVAREVQTQLLALPMRGMPLGVPAWIPPGDWVITGATAEAFRASQMVATDGSGQVKPLGEGTSAGVTPDGSEAVFRIGGGRVGGAQFVRRKLDGSGKPELLLSSPRALRSPHISPDGRLLAFAESDEEDVSRVYVTTYPTPGGRWQVSGDQGSSPQWDRTGRLLYYLGAGGSVFVVAVKASNPPELGKPQPLFTRPALQQFAVTPDGQRFLLAERSDSLSNSGQIVLLENWRNAPRNRPPAEPVE